MFTFKNICRLCTSDRDIISALNNFDTDNIILSDKINLIAPGLLKANSNLPTGICIACITQLNQAYKFVKNCFRSQEILEQSQNTDILKQYLEQSQNKQHTEEVNENNETIANEHKFDNANENFNSEINFINVPVKEETASDIDEEYLNRCNEFRNEESDESISKVNTEIEDKFESAKDSFNSEINFINIPVKKEKENEFLDEEYFDRCNEIRNESVNYNEESEENISKVNIEDDIEIEEKDVKNILTNPETENEDSCNDSVDRQTYGRGNLQNIYEVQTKTDETVKNNLILEGNSTKTSSKLAEHIGTHKSPYKCGICVKSFKTKHILRLHTKEIHRNERHHKCKICEKAFNRNTDLTRHYRVVHNNENPITCEICGRNFNTVQNLKAHTPIHDGPYTCNICEKTFTSKYVLKSHVKDIHVNEKGHTCEICEKAFNRSADLNRHIRIVHENERPHKCELCGQDFSQSQCLKIHIGRVHGNEKYSCEICGKVLSTSLSLKSHILLHANDKAYKCKICDKAFAQSPGLSAHIRTHIKQKLYECKICGKAFMRNGNLKMHIRTQHK